MICREILDKLEKKYPLSAAEDWDNPGLLAGRDDGEIGRIFVVLDVTAEAVREAADWGADLIISHHPLIFSPMKKISNCSFPGKKILELISHGIACYAMHTNFDVCAMADINARLLALRDPEVLCVTEQSEAGEAGIGRVGLLPEPMTLRGCAEYVKKRFGLPQVKVFGDPDARVERAAVSGGSGKSMVARAIAAGAEVLITGDIDHHTGLDAVDQGLFIIDAGHYGTEYFFMEQVRGDLMEIDPGLEVRCADVRLPYEYV